MRELHYMRATQSLIKIEMENSINEVENVRENEIGVKKNANSWIPLMRQIFVWSGVVVINMTAGMSCGIPNVMIRQTRREANSTDAVSDDMASWFTSVHGYAAVPWIILLPMVSKKFGRKIPFIFMGISSLIAYIIMYISTNSTLILISEVIQGILIGSNLTSLVVIVTEYTTPRYRGVLMTLKTSSFFWGLWIASAVGTFTHWKHNTYIAIVWSAYSLTAVFWPESPSWLAMRGRFKECAKAHYWLKGNDENSEKDLKSLINSQNEYIKVNLKKKHKSTLILSFEEMVKTIKSSEFYKPFLIGITVMMLFNFTGILTCTFYSLTLIEKMTNSESTAYIGMLIVEAISGLSMNVGCVLSKFLKRRTLLLTSCTLGVIFQFIISLYLYLIKLTIITEKHIITLTLLTIFSMILSAGPMILAYGLCGELTPLRFRSLSLPILAIFAETLSSTILKLFPFMSSLVGLHGVFLFYGIFTSFLALILCKYLPETKDKTLQEIEAFFKETEIKVSSASACASPLIDADIAHRTPVSSDFSSVPPDTTCFPINFNSSFYKTPYKAT